MDLSARCDEDGEMQAWQTSTKCSRRRNDVPEIQISYCHSRKSLFDGDFLFEEMLMKTNKASGSPGGPASPAAGEGGR